MATKARANRIRAHTHKHIKNHSKIYGMFYLMWLRYNIMEFLLFFIAFHRSFVPVGLLNLFRCDIKYITCTYISCFRILSFFIFENALYFVRNFIAVKSNAISRNKKKERFHYITNDLTNQKCRHQIDSSWAKKTPLKKKNKENNRMHVLIAINNYLLFIAANYFICEQHCICNLVERH